jgi:hypothetical protein
VTRSCTLNRTKYGITKNTKAGEGKSGKEKLTIAGAFTNLNAYVSALRKRGHTFFKKAI